MIYEKIEHKFHVGEARSHPSGYVLTGFTITSRKKINSYIKKNNDTKIQ